MDNISNKMVKVILDKLSERLNRELSKNERDAFSTPRSYMAYEMMIDFVSDLDKDVNKLEDYVKSVTMEVEK